jgi:hypothetical protein
MAKIVANPTNIRSRPTPTHHHKKTLFYKLSVRQYYHTSVRNKYFQENVYREKISLICANATVHCDTVFIQFYTENKNITTCILFFPRLDVPLWIYHLYRDYEIYNIHRLLHGNFHIIPFISPLWIQLLYRYYHIYNI